VVLENPFDTDRLAGYHFYRSMHFAGEHEMTKMTQYQVQVAAESYAAAALAHAGCNVSVSYATNQPEYDLLAEKQDRILKVQVKGSQDGAWGLTQSFLQNRDYHAAADKWLQKQGKETVFILVQFKDVKPGESARLYLASPYEISKRLKESAGGRGETMIYEDKKWSKRAVGYGTVDKVPPEWKFSQQRVETFFATYSA
jgi:Holliday junction resolvase-like predicted endonuclease